ncbi:MAG: formimidoylglutamate deiminase, partial [Nocardioidaceae bacterium]|nr:formimidoylglutamate deiminase [Nocardioidaceae bacterium]
MTAYWLERALLGESVQDSVRVEIEDGAFTEVEAGGGFDGAERLAGLTIPGFANCHSHAFHRALRGRAQRGGGTFWTWREQMYAVAERLDPDTYYALARATYREMVVAGITTVGEFHYLHHGRDGTPYDDPNEMGRALHQAAEDAGIRIVLLDTCYLAAGVGREPEGVQRRFSDGSADGWAARVDDLTASGRAVAYAAVATAGRAISGPSSGSVRAPAAVGAAVHSVRAVPRDEIAVVAAWADDHGAPLHVHLSEQVAENDECHAAYGSTPTELLAEAGALGQRTTAVHATHLTDRDIALLGRSSTYSCFCPTTERDLGDGIGPSRRLAAAGSRLTLGSDSHAVVDMFEEMRAVELDERLATQRRGHWSAVELLAAAAYDGHRSLGLGSTGRIEVGHRADLVTLDTGSPRTAGTGADDGTAVFAATSADVVHVVRDGR